MVRRIGFRARDLAARLEALRTGFFRRDAVRFVMVGSLGFTIEFGILVALVHGANWSPFLARAVAMATAFFCTWLLHRPWTFASGRVTASCRPSQPTSPNMRRGACKSVASRLRRHQVGDGHGRRAHRRPSYSDLDHCGHHRQRPAPARGDAWPRHEVGTHQDRPLHARAGP